MERKTFYNETRKKSGFTLLEIIIVIIIVGVLASLAMPRFVKTVEYARGMEALIHLGTIRASMQRYYVTNNNSYLNASIDKLDISSPNEDPNRMFEYYTSAPKVPADPTADTFTVKAERNTLHGGDATGNSWITIDQDGKKQGSGTYSAIQQ